MSRARDRGAYGADSNAPQRARLALSESRWLRFGSFTAFYFAQGVPLGLLSGAVVPWLAANGASEGQVAAFTAWVGLPWALKLIAGPFMDRFTFLPMGFRRPWVLALQSGLVLSLLVLAAVGTGFEDGIKGGSLLALTVAGAAVNAFAATQDVAVDGMAIDVLPAGERGRANAFMGFGQRVGYAAFSALCASLLVHFGIAAAALVCAVAVAAILLLAGVLRERPGERRLPWTEGSAAARERPPPTILGNTWSVLRVLVLPMSLVAIAVEFVSRLSVGMAHALFPVLAAQELGFASDRFSYFDSVTALATATLAVCFGPAIDRFGAKRLLFLSLAAGAAAHFVAGLAPWLWQDAAGAMVFYCLQAVFGQFVFVAVIALFMNLCASRVAATQFAVYMALANLGRSAGAGLVALFGERLGPSQELLLMGALLAASAAILLLLDEDSHRRRLASRP